jgi:hypothetical protein
LPSIILASGFYHYYITTVVNMDDEWLTIQGGTYTWEDCLIPENGYYVEDSYLLNGPSDTFVHRFLSGRPQAEAPWKMSPGAHRSSRNSELLEGRTVSCALTCSVLGSIAGSPPAM